MKKYFKEKKAITLIALVITIVVLIILAGVLINISLGNNGLFNKAKTAKEMYTNAQEQEELDIAKMTNNIDNYVDGNRDTITISKDEYNQLKSDVEYLKNNAIIYGDLSKTPIYTITEQNASVAVNQNCIAVIKTRTTANSPDVYVNNILVHHNPFGNADQISTVYLKKGDTISTRNDNNGQVYDIKNISNILIK